MTLSLPNIFAFVLKFDAVFLSPTDLSCSINTLLYRLWSFNPAFAFITASLSSLSLHDATITPFSADLLSFLTALVTEILCIFKPSLINVLTLSVVFLFLVSGRFLTTMFNALLISTGSFVKSSSFFLVWNFAIPVSFDVSYG